MNENEASKAPDQKDKQKGTVPPWLEATTSDLAGLDFEAPIRDSATADCDEMSDQFRKAANALSTPAGTLESSAVRVFVMLSAITGMHLRPQQRNEPFGAVFVLADGRRTAIPSDFRAHTDLLADVALRAINPVLRARVADVCWLLDRKRAELARLAVNAYSEIAQKVAAGLLRYQHASEPGSLHHESFEYLWRALSIGRAIGWDKPETQSARAVAAKLRQEALARMAPVPIHWFSDLDLHLGGSNASEVATSVESALRGAIAREDAHIILELWRLAARGFEIAKDGDGKNRCLTEAAECLVSEAQAKQGSAMLASHFLSAAIAQLSGVPASKKRRTELRHQLVEIQSRISDEMSTFSQEMDLQPIAENVQDVVRRLGFRDKLFAFASLANSLDPENLARDAENLIAKRPLASLFPTSHHDHEGKVIHRTPGEGSGDDSAIHQQIVQTERIRRQLVAFGKIEPARHVIINEHHVSDDILVSLLQHSPFVPHDLVHTFARGFAQFFQGDFVSAVYILTPLLENSLRHVLQSVGHDVSIFDDATQTQQDRTISTLFEQMRTQLDEIFGRPITTDVENTFLIRPGPSLRHALAHGLLRDGDPFGPDAVYACCLIFRLCILPLSRHRPELKFAWDTQPSEPSS